MDKLNNLIKYVAIFFVSYIVLAVLFSWSPMKSAHNTFYNGFGQTVFNMINPSIYADFSKYEGTNPKFDVTFKLYRESKFGSKISNPVFRKTVKPSYLVHNTLSTLVLIPCILLLSLIIATPNKLETKIIGALVGLFLYYIFISIYMSYRFENAYADGNFQPDSIWGYIVQFVGGYGLNEILYIVAVLIWALVSFTPNLKKT